MVINGTNPEVDLFFRSQFLGRLHSGEISQARVTLQGSEPDPSLAPVQKASMAKRRMLVLGYFVQH